MNHPIIEHLQRKAGELQGQVGALQCEPTEAAILALANTAASTLEIVGGILGVMARVPETAAHMSGKRTAWVKPGHGGDPFEAGTGRRVLSPALIEDRLTDLAIASYKAGFQKRNGSRVVKKWTADPEKAVRSLVKAIIKKLQEDLSHDHL